MGDFQQKYNLEIEEADNYLGPDGHIKEKVMLFNGPIISANWGDTVNVTVVNRLRTNGYHSHFSTSYDVDLGPFLISDWYYGSADQMMSRISSATEPFIAGQPGSPPESDNVLFNGTNVDPHGMRGGRYAHIHVTKGKRYRIRLINASVDNSFTISIVGHKMEVVHTDFVPVRPYHTDHLFLAVGQRYDVVIDAEADISNYWLNATFSETGLCGRSRNQNPAAILHYEDAPDPDHELPQEPGERPEDARCLDSLAYEPVLDRQVSRFPVGAPNVLTADMKINRATNHNVIPVLMSSRESGNRGGGVHGLPSYRVEPSKASVSSKSLPVRIEEQEVSDTPWSYWLIQNFSPVPHPMHLHGHDFVVLGRSPALPFPPATPVGFTGRPSMFNSTVDREGLVWTNPMRRDTTVLPGLGWLVVAFEAGNPGSWIFHCHIAWHVSQGFSVQFLEEPESIGAGMNLGEVAENCNAWRQYAPQDDALKADSGI
ncbi:hypothetical protein VTK73DRAFT_9532 [Phialemonium thermophilum]|uniref:laccase n=1 Tax=Phialemonium thermophilum TaxID=223376 RepID=A0ABR3XK61_9PEZI